MVWSVLEGILSGGQPWREITLLDGSAMLLSENNESNNTL